MKYLVLGGTQFVGYHIVERALRRGHDVTLFNRGLSSPGVFPTARHIRGDRDRDDLAALAGEEFDRVIDTTGFLPANVRRTCDALSRSVAHYTFVSSVRVYDIGGSGPLTESSPLLSNRPGAQLRFPQDQAVMTTVCEAMLHRTFGGRLLIVRPGLIAGPRDVTDRLTYWPRRVAAGGEILIPGPQDRLLQTIDVRDLASFIVDQSEKGVADTFNAVGSPQTFADILETCCSIAGSNNATLCWVDPAFLLAQGVKPGTELTCWHPGREGRRTREVNADKALRIGLRIRDLAETVRDTLDWDATRPRPLPRGKTGSKYWVETLEPDRESALLHLWRQQDFDQTGAGTLGERPADPPPEPRLMAEPDRAVLIDRPA
jgi:2'-hydroxyisoflavone reductase